MGTQLPFPQKGAHPQFSAHVCCGQTVAHLSYCWALAQTVLSCRPLECKRMNEWVEKRLDIRHAVSGTRYGYPFILIRPDLHRPAKFGFDSRARLTPDRISSISGELRWVGDIITDRVNIGRRQQAAGAAGNLGYQADFVFHGRYSNPIFGRKSTSNHHYIPLSFSGILSTKSSWLLKIRGRSF